MLRTDHWVGGTEAVARDDELFQPRTYAPRSRFFPPHFMPLSPLSDLLTTNICPVVHSPLRLFEGDTGTVSPSHASSSLDGGFGDAAAGIIWCAERCGAFASKDGGIGGLAGLDEMRRVFARGNIGRVGSGVVDNGCDLDIINDHSSSTTTLSEETRY